MTAQSSIKKPIDYQAIAICIMGRSPLAATLIRVQVIGRKVRLGKTTRLTLVHKAKRFFNKAITNSEADAFMHFYSEMGLGYVAYEYGTPVLIWNPRLKLHLLGEHLATLRRGMIATREIEVIGKGPTVVCMLPKGSLNALMRTGLAKKLEIELLRDAPRLQPDL